MIIPTPVTTTLRIRYLPAAGLPRNRRATSAPLLRVPLDIVHHVLDRLDLFGILVRDLDAELVFHRHYQLHDIEGIRSEIVDERRLASYNFV